MENIPMEAENGSAFLFIEEVHLVLILSLGRSGFDFQTLELC